jgi:hypothetical protein
VGHFDEAAFVPGFVVVFMAANSTAGPAGFAGGSGSRAIGVSASLGGRLYLVSEKVKAGGRRLGFHVGRLAFDRIEIMGVFLSGPDRF